MPTPTLYGRPGVYFTESLVGPSPSQPTTSPSVGGFAGEHWAGPSGRAILCNSWGDFVNYFGGFNPNATPVLANPYLPYSVYEFFANGGQSCWVQRIVGSITPGATASTRLTDTAATPQGTLTLTAGFLGIPGSIGSWGNNLFCDVVAGSALGRFGVNIYYGAYAAANLVESWTDMSMVKTDPRYCPAIMNSPTTGSLWVVAADLGDVSAFPNNMPALVSGKQFTGGIDCSDPSATDRVNAMTLGSSPFDTVPGVLNINMPGETTVLVIAAAITYAQTRAYTFLVIDPPSGQTPAGAVSYLQSLSPVSSYAAVYYPWLTATDPSSPNLRSTQLLPPGGFVLGQMTSMDTNSGVWHAPAGLGTVLGGVVQAERIFAPADLSTLNLANVNALRTRPNGNVIIWGTRTMQAGYASLYVPVRRTLNYIESALAQLLEFVVFAPNDGMLWSTIIATATQFLDGLWSAGAFAGNTTSSSFYVLCDDTTNTAQSISQGVVNTTVGLALVYPAEFIAVNIAQFQTTGNTVVTASN